MRHFATAMLILALTCATLALIAYDRAGYAFALGSVAAVASSAAFWLATR